MRNLTSREEVPEKSSRHFGGLLARGLLVLVLSAFVLLPMGSPQAQVDKYGDQYGYAQRIVANWGEPPAYSRWLGGIDDGGFFGLDKIVDGPHGIVSGHASTFAHRYEGRFVVMCSDLPVDVHNLSDLDIRAPMYGHFQFADVLVHGIRHEQCQLHMLDRAGFEYLELQPDQTLAKKRSPALELEGSHIRIPNPEEKYEGHFSYDPKHQAMLTIKEIHINNRKLEIQNASRAEIDWRSISFLVWGWKKTYLIFSDGSFAVLKDD
ncbi:MAG: hypothetical protein ABWY78_13645 [Microvirga sp.]